MKNETDFYNNIVEALAKIDWTLRDIGCEYFQFVNQRGERQPLVFVNDKIQSENTEIDFRFYFYLKDVQINDYGNAISFCGKTDESIFLTCHNFDSGKGTKLKNEK